ncbi:MAG TPA: hypothetical protein VJS15_06470, partial [Allosphingosinicella sp.]|nr:hypothetical protein [Allosphingosinicella sp.]
GVSNPYRNVLQGLNRVVPQPLSIELQVDTGCAQTMIDSQVAAALALPVRGWQTILTPSSGPNGVNVPRYDVSIVIPGNRNQRLTLSAWRVTTADFSAQGIAGLLGRDILERGRLFYSGIDAECFLSF